MSNKDKILQLLKDSNVIKFGDRELRSGEISSYYVDIKSATTHSELLYLIAYEVAESYKFDVVAGVALGGIPLAVAVSLVSRNPYAIIRKSDDNKKDKVIGDVSDKTVLLIEDVTTLGGTLIYGIEELRKFGACVNQAVSIVDREQGAVQKIKQCGVDLYPMTVISEIVT